MGRQIRFYMLSKDEMEFVNKVIKSGDYFVDDKGNKLTLDDLKKEMLVWIVSPKSRIVKNHWGHIDDDQVDGIQFVRSKIWEKSQVWAQRNVQEGRLWVQLKYYSSFSPDAQIITKEKWLEDKYKFYKRWIVKHTRISKDKFFYIGEETYLLYKGGLKMMQGPKTEIEFE